MEPFVRWAYGTECTSSFEWLLRTDHMQPDVHKAWRIQTLYGRSTRDILRSMKDKKSHETLETINGDFSLTFSRDETASRQIKHFLIRDPHASHDTTWPQGLKTVSRFFSEQKRHSSAFVSAGSSLVCWDCCWFSLLATFVMFLSSIVVVSMSSVCFSLKHLTSILHKFGSLEYLNGRRNLIFHSENV